MRDAAKLYEGGDEHKLSAKVVGRWTNGAPLVTHPDEAPRGVRPQDAAAATTFATTRTSTAMRCPLGAHVRRSNPRDALGAVNGPKGVSASRAT